MGKSPKVESKEDAKYFALIQQYNTLEKQWKSLENPKPRNPHSFFISSDSNTNTNNSITTPFYLSPSPRDLMHSLQESPSDRLLRDKPLTTAVQEILRDRRAAIVTGKLRGRRLFRPAEEKGVVVEEKRGGGRGFMALFAVVVLVISFGLIFMSCDAKYVHKDDGFIDLVPT